MSLYHIVGSLAQGDAAVHLTPEAAGWSYSGLQVLRIDPGEERRIHLRQDEVVLVPLNGSFGLASEVLTVPLEGRRDVFHELTDRAYLPPDTPFELGTDQGGDIALCTARSSAGGPARYLTADETSVEVRGAAAATRQVNGLWSAQVEGPERLIVVEVITPDGNWSSFPPHKHDEWSENEVPLEEIYYFRIAGHSGFGLHRTYTKDGEIDETVSVGDGDVFLVPRGYHGPCVAAPGHDMYYLNVMAGPRREWLISYDPAHEWVMSEWDSMPRDPRLPRV